MFQGLIIVEVTPVNVYILPIYIPNPPSPLPVGLTVSPDGWQSRLI